MTYKSFIRPHLDYGNIVHDQPNNSSLSEKIESPQFNATLSITSTINNLVHQLVSSST